jgi:expansin (peptidoglycan-binding protein)
VSRTPLIFMFFAILKQNLKKSFGATLVAIKGRYPQIQRPKSSSTVPLTTCYPKGVYSYNL